jgi:hypothetical protein
MTPRRGKLRPKRKAVLTGSSSIKKRPGTEFISEKFSKNIAFSLNLGQTSYILEVMFVIFAHLADSGQLENV